MIIFAAFAALPTLGSAQTPDIAATFAARPSAYRAALSPDGDRIVYVTSYRTGGRAVVVAEIATGKTNIVIASTDLSVVPSRCDFKSQTRLICSVWGIKGTGKLMQDFTRTLAVDVDGKNLKILGQKNDPQAYSVAYDGGGVLDWLPDDPSHVLMQVDVAGSDGSDTNIRAAAEGRAAALIDINTGVRRIVERSSPTVSSFDSDGQGNIRLRGSVDHDPSGYVRNRIAYAVRAKGSSTWRPLTADVISDHAQAYYDGFDETADNVFQLRQLDGRRALYKVAADGSGRSELVYAHPQVDVTGVQRIGKYNRAVGATYTLERDEVEFFDPKLVSLTRSLRKALPGQPDITIVDESWDGTKKLIYADGDSAPGRFYLFDGTTKKLGELVAAYPALDGVALGQVKPVRYAARDGTMIPAYLTLPPGKADARGLPAIVMPHGGPSARDSLGFDWLAQFFAAKGYAVLQPNFRGSTGYGQDFFAKNGFQSWQLAVGDINDGARWLAAQGIADAKKLAIVGWSYGGYAALQANVMDPGLYRATIAVAPVTDLPLLRQERLDYGDYKLVDAMIGNGPHVVAGSPAKNAAKIMTPVLIFHADHDLNVDIEQSRVMAGALHSAGKHVELVEYKGLDHQIDDSVARRDMLTRSAAFLTGAMP